MTTKQLKKLAKVHGWKLERCGSKHWIYYRNCQRITIPFNARGFVGHNIAKDLVK